MEDIKAERMLQTQLQSLKRFFKGNQEKRNTAHTSREP